MITEEPNKEARHQQAVLVIRQMLANKKVTEKEAIEAYKNNPAKQARVAKLRRENEEQGTPIVRL